MLYCHAASHTIIESRRAGVFVRGPVDARPACWVAWDTGRSVTNSDDVRGRDVTDSRQGVDVGVASIVVRNLGDHSKRRGHD